MNRIASQSAVTRHPVQSAYRWCAHAGVGGCRVVSVSALGECVRGNACLHGRQDDDTARLAGFPGVSLIQRDGATIGELADREGEQGPAVTLEPGQAAHADRHTANKGVSDAGCSGGRT